MGQKVHPTGFRIGIIYDWQSKWFADHNYRELLLEDLKIRDYLEETMRDAGVARVEIERDANMVTVTIHTAKPGIVIGRGGQKVDELRGKLETLTNKRIRVNIQEIRMPELEATLVARNIADQLERRVAFRRALRQTVSRTMARGAEGCKATVAGRLGGIEMSRTESTMEGRVPLHTMRADIDYGQAEAATTFGRIGVKVWIYKGDRLPERREAAASEKRPDEAQARPPTAAPKATPEPAPAEPPAAPPEATVEPAPAEPPAAAPEATAEPAPAEPPAAAPEATAEPPAAAPEATAEPPAAAPEATAEPPPAEPPAATAEPAPAEPPAAAPEATAEPAPAEPPADTPEKTAEPALAVEATTTEEPAAEVQAAETEESAKA
ncbi:MAG: 30S ribosomal protein S3 [Chloroflexi bacterium]|nr:30S ribosomal protein S3 [Chloroflexota bacterium]